MRKDRPMPEPDLTQQDEDLSAPEFDSEEKRDGCDFGNWPELAGLVLTLFVIWLIFSFRG